MSERRDQEMLTRIHSFHAVLRELAVTVETSGGRTPDVDRRLQALRVELEQARAAFDHLFGLMGHAPGTEYIREIEASVSTEVGQLPASRNLG
jgi:hypothetical protein